MRSWRAVRDQDINIRRHSVCPHIFRSRILKCWTSMLRRLGAAINQDVATIGAGYFGRLVLEIDDVAPIKLRPL